MKIEEELEALKGFKKRVLFGGLIEPKLENKYYTCSCYLREVNDRWYVRTGKTIRLSTDKEEFNKYQGCNPNFYFVIPSEWGRPGKVDGTRYTYQISINPMQSLEAFLDDDF